jgi:hypothetical protein
MATNSGEIYRQGTVRERVQIQNPVTKQWVKIDTKSGKIVDTKKTPGPFKGVSKKGR